MVTNQKGITRIQYAYLYTGKTLFSRWDKKYNKSRYSNNNNTYILEIENIITYPKKFKDPFFKKINRDYPQMDKDIELLLNILWLDIPGIVRRHTDASKDYFRITRINTNNLICLLDEGGSSSIPDYIRMPEFGSKECTGINIPRLERCLGADFYSQDKLHNMFYNKDFYVTDIHLRYSAGIHTDNYQIIELSSKILERLGYNIINKHKSL